MRHWWMAGGEKASSAARSAVKAGSVKLDAVLGRAVVLRVGGRVAGVLEPGERDPSGLWRVGGAAWRQAESRDDGVAEELDIRHHEPLLQLRRLSDELAEVERDFALLRTVVLRRRDDDAVVNSVYRRGGRREDLVVRAGAAASAGDERRDDPGGNECSAGNCPRLRVRFRLPRARRAQRRSRDASSSARSSGTVRPDPSAASSLSAARRPPTSRRPSSPYSEAN